MDINIDSDVLSNLKDLDVKMDDLTTEALANVNSIVPKTVNAFERY
jgi:post-segregation antitoxin (ccd killing protein)